MLQRLLCRLPGGAAIAALLVVTGSHQDRVVHRSAQLDGTDHDAGNEGQRVPGKVRDAHIDGDGRLNAGDQQHRDGQAAEGDQDNDQHRQDRPDVDVCKVHIGHLDQVLGHGALACDHCIGVCCFDQTVQLIQLGINGCRAGLIGAVGQNELVAAGLHQLQHVLRQQLGIKARPGNGVQAHHLGDALHLVDVIAQVRDLGGAQRLRHQDEVRGGHAKILSQFVGAHDAGQVLGQRIEQGVVHLRLALRQGKGNHDGDKHRQDRPGMAGNKVAQPGQLGDHGAVLVFLHRLIKEQDQGGQDDHRADHAQRHALGHYQADVPAQGQPHSAQRQEAGNGGQTGCGNGGHGLADGGDHCLLVGAAQLLFFLVAMQQEDGEVHGHAQLQHRGQRLGNVADLPQKDVGTKVVRNGEQKSDHKQQRRDRAFQREEQDRQAGAHCT